MKKPNDAVKILCVFESFAKELIPLVIIWLNNNKETSKAADIMKQFGFTAADFPEIQIRLLKKALRYYLSTFTWSFVVEFYKDNFQTLAWIVEDLVFKGKLDEAYTIL